jgi:hypothetical protein
MRRATKRGTQGWRTSLPYGGGEVALTDEQVRGSIPDPRPWLARVLVPPHRGVAPLDAVSHTGQHTTRLHRWCIETEVEMSKDAEALRLVIE